MKNAFGEYVRNRREELKKTDRSFSVRKVAARIRVEPSYLSNIERAKCAPPSEATIVRLAAVLGEDADVLLAMAGKVSSDLQDAIRKRPRLFAELIRQFKDLPDNALERAVREIRDGKW